MDDQRWEVCKRSIAVIHARLTRWQVEEHNSLVNDNRTDHTHDHQLKSQSEKIAAGESLPQQEERQAPTPDRSGMCTIGCQTAETVVGSPFQDYLEQLEAKEKHFIAAESSLRGKIRWLEFVVHQAREDQRSSQIALVEASMKIKDLEYKLQHAERKMHFLGCEVHDQKSLVMQLKLNHQETTSQNSLLQQKLDVCMTAYTKETSRLYEESQLLWSEAQSLRHKLNVVQVQAHSYKMELDRCRYNAEYKLQITKGEKSKAEEKMFDLEQQKIAMCLDLQQCYATVSHLYSMLYQEEHNHASQLKVQLAGRDDLIDRLQEDLCLQ